MKTAAVVPVKSLLEVKSRLSDVLSAEQRSALALDMLHHVLEVIAASGVIDRLVVVSPEADALRLPSGVTHLMQARPGLNNVLEQGRDWAAAAGAEALLVVLGDLPLLAPENISAMAALAPNPDTAVLAPDRHRVGTNAMLVAPLSRAYFSFGTRSYLVHYSRYIEAGMAVKTYSSEGTSLDVDTPDDLAFLAQHGGGPAVARDLICATGNSQGRHLYE
jgi:2-phospho-L-lactate/phosphoenolpyruvate guanylyltransferase